MLHPVLDSRSILDSIISAALGSVNGGGAAETPPKPGGWNFSSGGRKLQASLGVQKSACPANLSKKSLPVYDEEKIEPGVSG
jgi:hypothetical protein